MQTITLIALGKLNADYYAKAAAEYAKRLSAYCRLNIVELPEEPIAEKNASPAVIGKALEKEARAILTAVPKGSSLAALCVEGKQKTSEELAAYLDHFSLFSMAYSWGGFESLILANQPEHIAAIRPQGEVDFSGTLIRLHIGLENVDDLIADLAAGFARIE